jgi:hypothetical protein
MHKGRDAVFRKVKGLGLESITEYSKINSCGRKYLLETTACYGSFLPYSSLFTFCRH